MIWILYIFFWVFPRRQIVVGRRFGALYQFHLQRLGVQYCTVHPAFEDETDTGLRNVGQLQFDAGEVPRRKYTITREIFVNFSFPPVSNPSGIPVGLHDVASWVINRLTGRAVYVFCTLAMFCVSFGRRVSVVFFIAHIWVLQSWRWLLQFDTRKVLHEPVSVTWPARVLTIY